MNPVYLLLLACPIGMGLMVLFMGRGMMGMGHGDRQEASADAAAPLPADPEKRLAVLQAERQLLDARIAALETPEAVAASEEAGK